MQFVSFFLFLFLQENKTMEKQKTNILVDDNKDIRSALKLLFFIKYPPLLSDIPSTNLPHYRYHPMHI
jgi:hypothetical protein